MAGFELNQWIAAAPGEVFSGITDPARAPEVMPSTVALEQLTPGPLAAGTRLRETRLVRGAEAQTELLVEAYEPPARYVVSSTQSGITVTYTYTLRAEKDGTHVHLLAEVRGNGLKKVLVPVVSAIMKREDGDHLEHLKVALERG